MTSTVIIGAGQAGGRAAEALRANGYQGAIAVVGEESYPPYERPPLSKQILLGKAEPARIFLRPREFYCAQSIQMLLGRRCAAVKRAAREVVLDDGRTLSYRHLILATGARPRRLALNYDERLPVRYLRTLDDALQLRDVLRENLRLVVIGAGLIGLEIAAAARSRGCIVTVVESGAYPMSRLLEPDIGNWFTALHERHGVSIRTQVNVGEISAADRGAYVKLSDGTALEGDLVVIGIGVVPNSELAEQAGLDVDDGVLIDAYGRTSDPDIFATGDVARHRDLAGQCVRIESWQNAQDHAISVAKVIAGCGTAYHALPWFWSDQYDVNFQTIGMPGPAARTVWRGGTGGQSFMIFYLDAESRPTFAHAVNSHREIRFVKQVIMRRAPVDPEDLVRTDKLLSALAG